MSIPPRFAARICAGLFILASFSAPFASHALTDDERVLMLQELNRQLEALRAQIDAIRQADPNAKPFCPKITQDLRRGMEDDPNPDEGDHSIRELQTFLAREPYNFFPDERINGFFGPLTEQAVQDFQRKHSVVSWDDPGWGRVGPKTRTKIEAVCGFDRYELPPDSSYSVHVTSPNGDEVWARRSTQKITWTMQGTENTAARIFLINVKGDRTWTIDTVPSKVGANEYEWLVAGGNIDTEPVEPFTQEPLIGARINPGATEHFKVQVCILAYSVCDESDAKFEIKTSRVTLRVWVKDRVTGDQIDQPVGGTVIGRNIAYQCTTSTDDENLEKCDFDMDDGYMEFYGVPFGSYTIAAGTGDYQPAQKTVVINHGNAYYLEDGTHVRDSGIELWPIAPQPPVRVKLPKPEDILRTGTEEFIKWRGQGNNFKLELLGVGPDGESVDESRTWVIAEVHQHYLQELLEQCGDECEPVPDEVGLNNRYTWKVGECMQPCDPIPPGKYYVRVTKMGTGERDKTNKPVYIVGSEGEPSLSVTFNMDQINTDHVRTYVYYDPDGPGLPAAPIEITRHADMKTSDTFIMNFGKPEVGRARLNAGGVGTAIGTITYKGLRIRLRATIGGPEKDPIVTGIQVLSSGRVGEAEAPPTKPRDYTVGDRVLVLTNGGVNIRETPSLTGTALGRHALGDVGSILQGPAFEDKLWWWQVDFQSGADGWIAQDFLEYAQL